MKLVKLASHTVDLDALPFRPIVLDVGCRGFDFTREILEHRPWANVIAMDPSAEIKPKASDGRFVSFLRAALVGDDKQVSLFAHHSTGEGDFVCEEVPWYAQRHAVLCMNLPTLMRRYGIKFFDLIKLDCEGSEFGILENLPGPIAQQISVEFHDHTGPWEAHVVGDYYEVLFGGVLKDYEVVQHELSQQGTGIGHWDTLLRLRA